MYLTKLQRSVIWNSFWQAIEIYENTGWSENNGILRKLRLKKAVELGGIVYDLMILEEGGMDKNESHRSFEIWIKVRELVVSLREYESELENQKVTAYYKTRYPEIFC